MIPADKADAVARAMREAFDVDTFESIVPVTGGHTASPVFRVIVRGAPYLLKIITRAEDPSRHYASMRAAAEAGVAPRVLYTDTEAHVSITDFVGAAPISIDEARRRLPLVLQTLHAVPPFARAPFNTTCTFLLAPGAARDGFLRRFQSLGLLPDDDSREWFARHGELAAAYPYDDGEMRSCHNDLFKPDNVLFDGTRVWLVDWEAAFLNDRYADLAVIANQIATSDDEEAAFLEAYFGAPPSEYQRARLYVMRQIAHLFYTAAFLFTSRDGAAVDWSLPVPDLATWQQQMWAERLDLSAHHVKVAFARVNWNQLRQNTGQPQFRVALRMISGG